MRACEREMKPSIRLRDLEILSRSTLVYVSVCVCMYHESERGVVNEITRIHALAHHTHTYTRIQRQTQITVMGATSIIDTVLVRILLRDFYALPGPRRSFPRRRCDTRNVLTYRRVDETSPPRITMRR